MQRPAQRVVLVTGASRGLGAEIALTLAERGFRVWAGVREAGREELRRQQKARKVTLQEVALDVTDDESVASAMQVIDADGRGLHALVNNAGVTSRCCFEDFPESEIRRIFEVNTFGAMRVARHALPLLRGNPEAHLVMVSSIGGRVGAVAVAPYVASKFALEGFSESLYLELKPFNIHVSIVEPGMIKTGIWGEKRILPQAFDKSSPYNELFWSSERLTEAALNSSQLRPKDVAQAVHRILGQSRPRLRTVVGRRAGLVVSLRKHMPGELFEKLYFGTMLRHIMKSIGQTPSPESQTTVQSG